MNGELLFDFPVHTQPKAVQCGSCGQFSRVVRFVSDASPMSAENGGYFIVDCKRCGKAVPS